MPIGWPSKRVGWPVLPACGPRKRPTSDRMGPASPGADAQTGVVFACFPYVTDINAARLRTELPTRVKTYAELAVLIASLGQLGALTQERGPLPTARYAWPVLVGKLTLPDPVPDCSDIPKGPSRHLEIIGCDFAHIFVGATRPCQQQTGSVSHAAGRQSETMERYHEGTYHCSRACHADLGSELRPTRRFRTALQQLFPGQPRLRQQRVLTIERLRSEACRVSDWSK